MMESEVKQLGVIQECKKALSRATGMDRAGIYERMGDAYIEMEKGNKAAICYRYAHDNGLRTTEFIIKFAKSLSLSGKSEEAESILLEAMKESTQDIQKAEIYTGLAFVKRIEAYHSEAKKFSDVAISLVSEIGAKDTRATRVLAEANSNLGFSLWRMNFFKTAIEHFKRAIGLFDTLDDVTGLSEVNNLIGNVYYHLGDFNKSLEFWEKANEHMPRISYLNNVALIKMARGELDEAEEMFKKCIREVLRVGRVQLVPTVQLNVADVHFERGDLAKAKTWIELAEKSIDELDYSNKLADLHYAKARLALEKGDLDAADRGVEDGRFYARRNKSRSMEAVLMAVEARVAAARDDPAKARKLFKMGIERLRKLHLEYYTARELANYAEFLNSIGEDKDANEASGEARMIFEKMELDYEVEKLDSFGM